MILGFSCVTMAILTTRMLDSKKERIIATFLLLLGVPCALQEQNALPGSTNRLVGRWSRRIYLGFAAAAAHFRPGSCRYCNPASKSQASSRRSTSTRTSISEKSRSSDRS